MLLYAVDNSTSIETINPHLEIRGLVEQKYVNYEQDKSVDITKKGRDIIVKYDAYFTKAKKKTNIHLMDKESKETIEKYSELCPAGK